MAIAGWKTPSNSAQTIPQSSTVTRLRPSPKRTRLGAAALRGGARVRERAEHHRQQLLVKIRAAAVVEAVAAATVAGMRERGRSRRRRQPPSGDGGEARQQHQPHKNTPIATDKTWRCRTPPRPARLPHTHTHNCITIATMHAPPRSCVRQTTRWGVPARFRAPDFLPRAARAPEPADAARTFDPSRCHPLKQTCAS